MPNQEIVVEQIVAPAAGKKQYQVIDTEGNRWGVWPDHIGEYTIGGIYRVVREKTNQFQGKTYYTIEEAQYVGMDDGSTPTIAPPAPRPAPAPRRAPPRAAPRAPAPRANGARYSPTDSTKSLEIFVCGAINNLLQNPNVNPLDLKAQDYIRIIGDLRAAWRNTLGQEQRDDDMNDEIPL